MARVVGELADAGFAGIEAVYGRYSPRQRAELGHLARRFDLVATGGSDHHGTIKPDLRVGTGQGDLKVPDRCSASSSPAGRRAEARPPGRGRDRTGQLVTGARSSRRDGKPARHAAVACARPRSTRPSTTSRSPPVRPEHPEPHPGLGRPGHQLRPPGGAHHHPGRRLGEQLVVVGEPDHLQPDAGTDGHLGQGHPQSATGHVVDARHQGGPPRRRRSPPATRAVTNATRRAWPGRSSAGRVPSPVAPDLDGPARAGQGRRTLPGAWWCPRWRPAGPVRPAPPGSPRGAARPDGR